MEFLFYLVFTLSKQFSPPLENKNKKFTLQVGVNIMVINVKTN